MFNDIMERVKNAIIVILIIFGIIGFISMDYIAFKQQFPSANVFTYIMRG